MTRKIVRDNLNTCALLVILPPSLFARFLVQPLPSVALSQVVSFSVL